MPPSSRVCSGNGTCRAASSGRTSETTRAGEVSRGNSRRWASLGKVRLSKNITTPFEVDVSDRTGARTYFWQREPRVLNTLDTADLSLLRGARMLYVDWYDGDHIVRAMDAAID